MAVFIAFVLIFGAVRGSDGSEWYKHGSTQLRSALGDFLRIDGNQVKSDGRSNASSTFFSLSNTLNDNFEEIVILEGIDGRVIAIDQKSDAVIVKTPLRTISSYNSLHRVMAAEPEILFKQIARSSGSKFYYFKSALPKGSRILGFNQPGDALPASQVIPGSDESLFTLHQG